MKSMHGTIMKMNMRTADVRCDRWPKVVAECINQMNSQPSSGMILLYFTTLNYNL
jgi:hypothetical protein